MTGPRQDALPEFHDYTDDGCEVAPHCLECPLPRCRYELPGIRPPHPRSVLSADRQAFAQQAHRDGMTPDAIAEAMAVSRRTVFRLIARPELRR